MIQMDMYDIKIYYCDYKATIWTILATQDEIIKIVEALKNKDISLGLYLDISYTINTDANAVETHRLDSEGLIWCKTSIKIDFSNKEN